MNTPINHTLQSIPSSSENLLSKKIAKQLLNHLLTTLGIAWCLIISPSVSTADEGYRLWLKYDRITDAARMDAYQRRIEAFRIWGSSPTLAVAETELKRGLEGLLGRAVSAGNSTGIDSNMVIVGTLADLPQRYTHQIPRYAFSHLGPEGYTIREVTVGGRSSIAIIANEDIGILYGVFHFLRLLQMHVELDGIDVSDAPKVQWRMLNHWDNLNGTVERGYAGLSIWDWETLPQTIQQRYVDYARANASVGINGVALNNVNASPEILREEYLSKVAALAAVFRPYGIRVFLSVNFASPKVLGGLDTADPSDERVRAWWQAKTEAIYRLIPDFGGFLVKANSEGQPGPQDYGRTHAEGANMLARALDAHGGTLIWRAFVYEAKGSDRVMDAYDEFARFDGQFLPNVFVQTKNGPLDFQPREPFAPLFGAMPNTPQMLEFQITQEYLGFSTHLVYLATLYKEVLESDTYVGGKGATVAKIIDGSQQGQRMTGVAGVANIGNVGNWTYHPFGQANWYAYGRLAWDHALTATEIAQEWIRMTLTTDEVAVNTITEMMVSSYEHLVNYQTPLGLNVLSSVGHHYGPQPWRRAGFHRADTAGIGFDRTGTGSNAVVQYSSVLQDSFGNVANCPDKFLLWFHRLPWDYEMASGRTLWEELCFRYHDGVAGVRQLQEAWKTVRHAVCPETFQRVNRLLAVQEDEAVWWRDACLWYFATVAQKDVPPQYEKPRYTAQEIKKREMESKDMKHFSTSLQLP
ncbi:alpha-glucuronidase [Parapedobacter composti]|uniref:Xylan alpha-1,2-glucuronidase n=1 Tax=Parapedobacter composti TaxID=623281 RepID=A0A1I1F0I5_9SPHI|nr:alpha-glucuronidase family glycosyl hydrolase [Parapedobacter composti]SFB90663.1 alpha-glucuronidase [Parapedobacter composti]